MLNSGTKQKINNLRDLLVGKIPNPQGQVQQITLALMYKFMSDIDDSTNELFENTTFFPGEFAEYKWTHIMDSKLSAQERLNLYAEGLEKMNHNPSVPQLFRHIFKQAFLPFRDPQTLDRFLKQIDEFEYEHSEDLGDAFEYLLSSLSAAGDAGQFRTPRHIIDFIVEVVQPDLSDKILDPACGTAGFLISAYKYLVKHHNNLDMNKISNQIVGYDISPEMVQLALVNLYLHQFPDPKIEEYDTLTSEAKRSEKFDCILANPPFMTPKGGITPHNKFSITSNRSEVLFVDYIMEHLRSTGKAGIIVPEGVIFQSANAYKALRKALIDTGGLWAVVSLPAGVFQPYSGVKTSILLLDKTIKTDDIVFAKITADGYDLGAQRRESSNNDLPTVLEDLLEIKGKLKAGQALGENSNPLIWSVEKSVIADSGDHNLSAERYKVSTAVYQGNWEMVELGEVVEIYDSKRKPLNKSERKEGIYPYYGATGIVDYVDDYLFEERLLLLGEDGAKRGSGEKTAFMVEGKYWVNNHAHVLKCKEGIIIDTYLTNILNELDLSPYITGVTVPKLNQEKMRSIQVPLPPLEIQEQIVAELDSYQAIIDGAKTIITNRKPKIDIQEDWEMVELGEIGKISMCKRIFKEETSNSGEIPFYKIGTFGKEPDAYISRELFDEYKKKFSYPKKGEILLSTSGTIGRTVVFDGEPAYFQDSNIVWLENDENKILNKYLYMLFQNIEWITTKGGTIERLYNKLIEKTIVAIPPLEIQQQIVAEIEQEQKLVDSAKELVDIYENKIQERVRKVWEG